METPLSGKQELLLDLLIEHGELSGNDIREETGFSRTTAFTLLRQLASWGYVETERRVGRTKPTTFYRITEEGRRIAVTPNPAVWEGTA